MSEALESSLISFQHVQTLLRALQDPLTMLFQALFIATDLLLPKARDCLCFVEGASSKRTARPPRIGVLHLRLFVSPLFLQ